MAKISSHIGVLAEATAHTGTKYRLMMDGYWLMNFGGGWKLCRNFKGAIRGRPLHETTRLSASDCCRIFRNFAKGARWEMQSEYLLNYMDKYGRIATNGTEIEKEALCQ